MIFVYDFYGSGATTTSIQNNVNNKNSRQWKSLSATVDKMCYFGIIPTRKTNLNLKQICFSGLAQFDSVCVRLPKSHQLS